MKLSLDKHFRKADTLCYFIGEGSANPFICKKSTSEPFNIFFIHHIHDQYATLKVRKFCEHVFFFKAQTSCPAV